MSHLHGSGKQYKAFLPFVNNVVKHTVHNYRPGVSAYATGSDDVKEKHAPVMGQVLKDAEPLKIHGYPLGHESLMYGWGHGMPELPNNPSAMKQAVHNRRSLVEVNNLDFGNYYKFTK